MRLFAGRMAMVISLLANYVQVTRGEDWDPKEFAKREECVLSDQLTPIVWVSCSYKYVAGDKPGDLRNYLEYYIQTSGTAMEPVGWARGIIDNVLGQCGIARDDLTHTDNINDFDLDTVQEGFDYNTGEEHDFIGASFWFRMHGGHWTPGEDYRECVSNATKHATCPQLAFRDFECVLLK